MVKFFFSSVTIIVLSFFALSNILVAQNPVVFYENVVPPSPNAASLGKYGEIPVDKFRGIPSISIPLYTIQVDDINIPISISFHASGHKVGEKASWVGLGWSLNAGGVVTRSMKGGPDEGGYFFNINKVLEWNTQGLLDYVYLLNTSSPDVSSIKQKMFEFYTDQRDIQPDLFFYNFPGGSGKFLFDPQQNIVQIPFQDYRITPTGLIARDNTDGQLDGFTIDDLNGLQSIAS